VDRPATDVEELVSLRPVVADDREFLLELYASTRREELDVVAWGEGQREAFLRMQFQVQDAEYRRLSPHGSFDVVEVDGSPAGRLYVDRRPGEVRIIDIALVPELRGRGIGGALIAALQREAESAGSAVSLQVETHNRAARLYERLGFVPVADSGVHRHLEWRPS
jgi:ribosomal protein S18 acetylase RimI-like enzyme